MQKPNVYSKKSGELAIISDATRLRMAIGRPPQDHSKRFKETMDRSTSMFQSQALDGETEERSLLRHRSISSLLKNQNMTENSSKFNSRR